MSSKLIAKIGEAVFFLCGNPTKHWRRLGERGGGVGLAKMAEGRWKMETLIAPLFIL